MALVERVPASTPADGPDYGMLPAEPRVRHGTALWAATTNPFAPTAVCH